jgi:hypothetical protein
MEIGDTVYINKNFDMLDSFINTTSYIIDIKPSSEPGRIDLILSFTYDIEEFQTMNIQTPLNLNLIIYKKIKRNTIFNYKFNDFAMNKNIIISKMQNTIDIMKTSSPKYNQTNRFPMIDEHGVTTIDRNIFKSSWDLDYYYTQINNKYTIL